MLVGALEALEFGASGEKELNSRNSRYTYAGARYTLSCRAEACLRGVKSPNMGKAGLNRSPAKRHPCSLRAAVQLGSKHFIRQWRCRACDWTGSMSGNKAYARVLTWRNCRNSWTMPAGKESR
jgi:hypothetical protein